MVFARSFTPLLDVQFGEPPVTWQVRVHLREIDTARARQDLAEDLLAANDGDFIPAIILGDASASVSASSRLCAIIAPGTT